MSTVDPVARARALRRLERNLARHGHAPPPPPAWWERTYRMPGWMIVPFGVLVANGAVSVVERIAELAR